ncbi:hypothetical protein ACUNHO_24385 [Serratia sp. IR-2025]
MSKLERFFFKQMHARAMREMELRLSEYSPEREWIAITYPGLEEGSEAWDRAAQEYYDWCELDIEVTTLLLFEASLENVGDRYDHALRELDELQALLAVPQPIIVSRLAYVHCVTVMEAFLMYAARAMLNLPSHLARFHERKACFILNEKKRNALDKSHQRDREKPADPSPSVSAYVTLPSTRTRDYMGTVRDTVGAMTFHNVGHIERYFRAMLTIPPDWPLDDTFKAIIETRQDLVHRNGITKEERQVVIKVSDLELALCTMRKFITLANADFQAEIALHHGAKPDF